MHYLLAIDQGTTSSRSMVFDRSGLIVSAAQQEFPQLYPADGRVEHDPEVIWSTTLAVARAAMQEAESEGGKVAAIGITNQRETTIVWDRESGQPVHNAIVWQDRRTADYCEQLKNPDTELLIQNHSGLLLDPYFSSSKLNWILDNVDGAGDRAIKGHLAFGTVDTFLLWKLTGGKVHATDVTNASRTGLFNIHTRTWDRELLDLFKVPEQVLPEVKPCTDDFGETEAGLFGRPIPVCGIAGDQQAAAIGQCCFEIGDVKSTYGTGCFVLINTGNHPLTSKNRLLTTIAYKIGDLTHYALEGSIFIAGAAVQWLRDGLGIISSASETEGLACSIDDNAGVYMVPAFTGLGAPYWDPGARGAVLGLTRSSGKPELARATLESVCYQTHDLIAAMQDDGVSPGPVRVDGGMVSNNWLMQFLADIIGIEVDRPKIMETTALGAAYLAGLQLGIYRDLNDITRHRQRECLFKPQMPDSKRRQLLAGWRNAVERVLIR